MSQTRFSWVPLLVSAVVMQACGPQSESPEVRREMAEPVEQLEQNACGLIECGALEAASTIEPDCNTRSAVSPYNCGVRKRSCDGQRLTNRNAAWTEDRTLHPVSFNGYHNIKDGGGGHLGWLTGSRVHINYGQAKDINGVKHLYVWAASTDAGGRSGWLDYRAFSDWACLSTFFFERNHHTPSGSTEQAYTLIPANNSLYMDAAGNALNIQPSQPCSGSE